MRGRLLLVSGFVGWFKKDVMLDSDRYWDCLDQAVQASTGGRTDEALAWIDEALKHNPEGAEALNGRGEILWEQGRLEPALREFDRAAEMAPEFFPAQLNRIELLIEEFQEQDEALDRADELLGRSLEGGIEAEVYYLKAKAFFYLDDLEGALFLLRRALQVQGEVGVYRGFEGQVLFELGQFGPALRSLEKSDALEPEVGHTLYHLALVHEHQGEFPLAESFFERAAALQPGLYPMPVRMPSQEFDEAARAAVDELPDRIRQYIANCPILIQDLPAEQLVRHENLSPQILGLFTGVPATEAGAAAAGGSAQPLDVDHVMLFKRNLEKVAGSVEELIEQVQITVRHEIGHYLGLGEEDLERLGLG